MLDKTPDDDVIEYPDFITYVKSGQLLLNGKSDSHLKASVYTAV